MDPRLLRLYNEELTYLREGAREFGEEHEEVAGRLGFKTPTDPDPYVERLLEGVAFLSARVQLKQQDQFPEFTQQLLQAVEPHYLAPMPSICIAGFEPKLGDPALVTGHVVAKGTELAATATAHNNASVVFRTGHDVTLWPIEIEQVEYLGSRAAVAQFAAAANVSAEAGLRLRFKAGGGHALSEIRPDAIALYLDGSESVPGELYRQLCGDALAVVARDAAAAGTTPWLRLPLPAQIGFDEAEALLPTERRAFSGYRLLSEYFACPERFLFVELREPGQAFARSAEACDIVILFSRAAAPLVRALTPANFRLFATPAINLVERQLGRVAITPHTHEYHVIPDRTRPLDFEVFKLLDVQAHARDHSETRPVAPLYAYGSLLYDWQDALFYTVQFRQRRLSTKEQRLRRRTDYIGTETWISLTAPGNPDRLSDVHELGIRALVTNRELPELLAFRGDTHFTVSGQPVSGARVLRSPTRPRPPLGIGDAAWRVIGHLTPNYLTLVGEGQEDAPLLRDHLTLYGRQDDPTLRRQVDAIRGIRSRIVTRRLPGVDRLAVARGRHIHLELDDAGFDNARLFLFAAVIERFLADFTTINSFTETSVSTPLEGNFVRWPARIGRRHTI